MSNYIVDISVGLSNMIWINNLDVVMLTVYHLFIYLNVLFSTYFIFKSRVWLLTKTVRFNLVYDSCCVKLGRATSFAKLKVTKPVYEILEIHIGFYWIVLFASFGFIYTSLYTMVAIYVILLNCNWFYFKSIITRTIFSVILPF